MEIEGLAIVRPGDTLIVALRRESISQKEADEYKQRLHDRVPGLADVVLLGGAAALAVYRPDDDAH